MINKTFNSDSTDGRALEVGRNGERPWLNIREFDLENTMFMLATSDAPALCLAILEAAGFKAEFHATGTFQDGDCWQLENVAQVIKDYLSIKDAEAAEARELAELEAEALELLNAYRKSFLHCAPEDGFDGFDDPDRIKAKWLAVARRARELAKEATK